MGDRPCFGGFLALKAYPLMFSVTSAAYFMVFILILCCLKDSPHRRHESTLKFKEMVLALSDKRFAVFCFYSLLIYSVMSQLAISLSLYSIKYLGLAENHIGILFSINGIVVILFQYGAGKLLEKFRITLGMAFGCLLYCAGYTAIGFAGGFISAAAGMLVLSLGEVAVSPGMNALAANLAPPEYKGRYLGMQGFAQQIGCALGVILGTWGVQFLCPIWKPAPWCIVGGLALSAGFGFYGLRKFLTRQEDGLKHEYLVIQKETTCSIIA